MSTKRVILAQEALRALDDLVGATLQTLAACQTAGAVTSDGPGIENGVEKLRLAKEKQLIALQCLREQLQRLDNDHASDPEPPGWSLPQICFMGTEVVATLELRAEVYLQDTGLIVFCHSLLNSCRCRTTGFRGTTEGERPTSRGLWCFAKSSQSNHGAAVHAGQHGNVGSQLSIEQKMAIQITDAAMAMPGW